MALNAYIQQTQRLLQNPPATTALYSTADLTVYVNVARNQIAGESGCIRVIGSLPTTAGNNNYPFSSINLAPPGVNNVLNVRQVTINVTNGFSFLHSRPWEWFNRYRISQVNMPNAMPTEWAQYGEGVLGSVYLNPTPDMTYQLNTDAVCLPIPLASDTDPEAIPTLWTDAIPFYAAYYALMSSQRQNDADTMYKRYEEFMERARRAATAAVLPGQYPQVADPTMQNKLGMRPPQQRSIGG